MSGTRKTIDTEEVKPSEETKAEETKTDKSKVETKAEAKVETLELVRAGRFNATYLKHPLTKGDKVSATDVRPDIFKRLKATGMFKLLALVMFLGMFMSAPAAADGVNFTYNGKIGWANAYLNTLATVFSGIDSAITTVSSSISDLITDLASNANGEGASLIGIEDAGTLFTATDVEAALAEGKAIIDAAPTMASNGTAGNIIYTPAADKALADASVALADLVTMSSAAAGAGYVLVSNGADKTAADSTIDSSTLALLGGSLTDGTLPVANASGALVDSALTDTNATTLTDGSDATALHIHTDMVGDTGAGGTAGFVPAPGAGDAAAGKYLDADGTWTVPPSVSGLTATGAEINAVADLSETGMVIRHAFFTIDEASERASGIHDTGIDLPGKSCVLDVFVIATTTETSATTKEISVCRDDDAGTDCDDGEELLGDDGTGERSVLATTAPGFNYAGCTVTNSDTGGNEGYFSAATCGELLCDYRAGSDVDGDSGLCYKHPACGNGVDSRDLLYELGSEHTEYVATIVVKYLVAP